MPAITLDTADSTTPPPTIAEPIDGPASVHTERRVRSVTTAPSGYEGEGFPVHRAFGGVDLSLLDPFIHMDQMGEVDYAPGEPKGTAWHPHRGFETVTYMIDGTFLHQDSHGGGGVLSDGDTQWMTAGSGLLHIETPPEELVVSGGRFHGIQLWVNLPAADKMTDPRYQHLDRHAVTLLSSPDGGALVRLIAGDVATTGSDGGSHAGPGATRTPITLAHATIEPTGRLAMPWRSDFNALAYALAGAGTAGTEQAPLRSGQLAVFGDGDRLTLQAAPTERLDVLLLGGRPIGEPVAAYGPFVMNTRAELQQAVDDFNAGRLGTVPADGIQPFRS